MKKTIVCVVLLIVVSAGAFFLGAKYPKTKNESVSQTSPADKMGFQIINPVDMEEYVTPEFEYLGELFPDEIGSEGISRTDYTLIDISYDRKDTGAIIIWSVMEDKYYMSTSVDRGGNNEFCVATFPAGKGITPAAIVSVYKNGECVKSVDVARIHYGDLEDTFFPVKKINAKNIDENNPDIVAKYTTKPQSVFTITCTIRDEELLAGEDEYSCEKAIEDELNKLYCLKPWEIEARSGNYSSKDDYRKYYVTICCEKEFYNTFNRELLMSNNLLLDAQVGEFHEFDELVYYYVLDK